MKTDFDAIIIGGGPAGGLSACLLAGAGVRTALIEKEKLPRYKTCGGGLVVRAVDQIPFEISDVVARELDRIHIVENELNLEFFIQDKFPVIRMVMRKDFDNLLVQNAEVKGCEIYDSLHATDLEISEEQVRVKTGKQNFTAKYLIASDGATGLTSRLFNKAKKCKKVPALEYEIYTDTETQNSLFNSARFDFGIIPEGYGWVFPKKKHLSIGIASMSNGKVDLKNKLSDYLLNLGIDQNSKSEKHGFVIPMRNGSVNSTLENRIFFCGDAAALADPITAEGISNALLSGKLAAESIIAEFGSPKSAANLYETKLSDEILRELKFAKFLAGVFYRHNRVRKYLLTHHGQRMAELMGDIVTGRAKYSVLLSRFSNYLKLLHRTKK